MSWTNIYDQARKRLKHLLVFVRLYGDCWKRNQVTIRAGALTYTSILSLVPAMAVCIFLFAQVAKYGRIPQGLESFLARELPTGAWNWLQKYTDFSSFPTLFKQFLLENLASGTGEQVFAYLDQFVSNVNFEAIGYSGSIALLITGILLLFAIEASMNLIWSVPENKRMSRRLYLYSGTLMLAPLVLSLSFVSSRMVTSLFPDFLFPAKMAYLMAAIIMTALAFRFFPNTKVSYRAAILAAAATVFSLELLKAGFAIYMQESLVYNSLYGSLAVFPFFLVWLYLCWIVVLSGVQLCFVIENRRYLRKLGEQSQWTSGSIFAKERGELIFRLAAILAEGDRTRRELIDSVDMPEFAVRSALSWMRSKRWIRIRRRRFTIKFSLSPQVREMPPEEAWREILGYRKSELQGKNIWETFQASPKPKTSKKKTGKKGTTTARTKS